MSRTSQPADISALRLRQLSALIAAGREASFYDWPEWDARRAEVFALDRNECVRCRERYHRVRRPALVHHVKHLRDRPDLALSIFDPDTGERQLVSLCRPCHEDVHPERGWRRGAPARAPLTAERWD